MNSKRQAGVGALWVIIAVVIVGGVGLYLAKDKLFSGTSESVVVASDPNEYLLDFYYPNKPGHSITFTLNDPQSIKYIELAAFFRVTSSSVDGSMDGKARVSIGLNGHYPDTGDFGADPLLQLALQDKASAVLFGNQIESLKKSIYIEYPLPTINGSDPRNTANVRKIRFENPEAFKKGENTLVFSPGENELSPTHDKIWAKDVKITAVLGESSYSAPSKKLTECTLKENVAWCFFSPSQDRELCATDKSNCLENRARDSKDIADCEEIQVSNSLDELSKSTCYGAIAGVQHNINLCVSATDKDSCNGEYAIGANDISGCKLIADANQKDLCYGILAVTNKNSEQCNLVQDKSFRANCMTGVENAKKRQ